VVVVARPNTTIFYLALGQPNDDTGSKGEAALIFPTNPSNFSVSNGARVYTYDLVDNKRAFGKDSEAVFHRGTRAKTISWDGMFFGFEASKFRNLVHDYRDPQVLCEQIEGYVGRTRVVVVCVVNGFMVSMPAIIEEFSYNPGGGYGNVGYSISFKRSTRLKVGQIAIPSGAKQEAGLSQRPVKPAPSTYTVRPGDTLQFISRRVYGSFDRWRYILSANRDIIADDANLVVGTRLRIPSG
jgi:nucleoid-associated protein YgaU